MGWLTDKMPKGRKQSIVVAFDIIVIIVFIWFAFTQRNEFINGYDTCSIYLCNRQADMAKICENITNQSYDIINGVNITEKYCGMNGTGGCFY